MRALLDCPAAVPEQRYRTFVRRAQIEGYLADHTVLGEPYLALNAVVLDRAEDAALRRLTTVFASAFDSAGRALRGDVAGLVDLGFPWPAAELLAAEPPRQPLVGRFDFALDGDGRWQVLEFNADTPSGVRETVVGDRLVRELAPGAADLDEPSSLLAPRLIDAFDAAVPAAATLGIVTSKGELEDFCQAVFTAELLRPRLAERGRRVVVGDGRELRSTARGVRLAGRSIGALYRLLPFEAALGAPLFAALFDAVAGGRLHLLNGLYGLLLQHKGVMAWLWAHRADPRLPPEERAAIAEHLPPTWLIDALPAHEPRDGLVAKQFFGREGEEVHFGADMNEAEWRELTRRRTYVAQRRVAVREMEAAVPSSVGAERWRGHATVGAFTVDGAWAGYYARFGPKVITHRSKWLATLVG